MFSNFFSPRISSPLSDNVKKYSGAREADMTVWGMRVACWLSKDVRAKARACASTRACARTHKQATAHTHRTYNTYWLSTATVVSWKGLLSILWPRKWVLLWWGWRLLVIPSLCLLFCFPATSVARINQPEAPAAGTFYDSVIAANVGVNKMA